MRMSAAMNSEHRFTEQHTHKPGHQIPLASRVYKGFFSPIIPPTKERGATDEKNSFSMGNERAFLKRLWGDNSRRATDRNTISHLPANLYTRTQSNSGGSYGT